MKKPLPAFVALLIIIGLGVGLIYRRHRHRQSNRPWSTHACSNGLASVDNTIQPILKIDLLETNCENDIASVHFNVTNVGTTPLKYFYVRAIYTFDSYVDDGSENGTGPLGVGQSKEGFFGQGTPRSRGESVGRLHSITLVPSLLEFPDGNRWQRASIHEPTRK